MAGKKKAPAPVEATTPPEANGSTAPEQPAPEGTTPTPEPEQVPEFPRQVQTAAPVPIRKGPGMGHRITGTAPRGKHTILEEADGWGRLKSGKGWIDLRFTQPI